MDGNGALGDEEAQHGGHRVQPFSSTPMSEHTLIEGKKEKIPTTLGAKLGLDELFSLKVWRASVAEIVGTAVLVFMIDTIVISTYHTGTSMPNLIISVFISFMVSILVLTCMPVSGGHINPAVTFSAALVGLISLSRAFVYLLAQCLGAVIGALALRAVVSSTIEDTFSLGGCTLTVLAHGPNGPVKIGLQMGPVLWLETICTFVFLFASIHIAFDIRRRSLLGPVMICLIIGVVVGVLLFVSVTVTGKKGYAGVGMNPARCLGPALIRGGHLWDGHWVFWAGPAIASVAFYLYTKIIPRQPLHCDDYKHDFLSILKSN